MPVGTAPAVPQSLVAIDTKNDTREHRNEPTVALVRARDMPAATEGGWLCRQIAPCPLAARGSRTHACSPCGYPLKVGPTSKGQRYCGQQQSPSLPPPTTSTTLVLGRSARADPRDRGHNALQSRRQIQLHERAAEGAALSWSWTPGICSRPPVTFPRHASPTERVDCARLVHRRLVRDDDHVVDQARAAEWGRDGHQHCAAFRVALAG